MIVGLTGGIASGKTTVSNFFKEIGIKIADADIIAKEISQRKDVEDEMIQVFGKEILDVEGKIRKINRAKVKEIVFSNKEKLSKLNEIIHPKVIEEFKKIKENTAKNDIIIFDVPLLFETELDKICDIIILVYVDRETQIKRMFERDNISEELAVKIINAQMSLEEKIKKSHVHIENNGTLDELQRKVQNIYRELKRKAEGE